MSFSTHAYLFFGAEVTIPDGVDWDVLDADTAYGIKMIHYGSDGDSMYAVAIKESVRTSVLDSPALSVSIDTGVDWPKRLRALCKKHKLAIPALSWLLAVSRF